jgi:hypothetical protein
MSSHHSTLLIFSIGSRLMAPEEFKYTDIHVYDVQSCIFSDTESQSVKELCSTEET